MPQPNLWTALQTLIKLRNLSPALEQKPAQDDNPLSFAQERLWFLNQRHPNSTAYNIPLAFELQGDLKVSALTASLNALLKRQAALRATFPLIKNKPAQRIQPFMPLALPLTDLRVLPPAEREAVAERLLTTQAQKPFDLGRETSFRVQLLQLEAARFILAFTIHHISFDVWSQNILCGDLSALYNAFVTGQPNPLPPLPLTYTDFVHWQRAAWETPAFRQPVRDYWEKQVANLQAQTLPYDAVTRGEGIEAPLNPPKGGTSPVFPPPKVGETEREATNLTFPTTLHQTQSPAPSPAVFPPPKVAGMERGAASQPFTLPADLTANLKQLAQAQGNSLFVILSATFNLGLHCAQPTDERYLCTPFANRTHSQLKGVLGYFANLVLLRMDFRGDPSLADYLAHAAAVVAEATAYQDMPTQFLETTAPLSQVLCAYQNVPAQPLRLTGLTATPREVLSGEVDFDLFLELQESGPTLGGRLLYNAAHFQPTTIAGLLKAWQHILTTCLTDLTQPISTLPRLTQTSPSPPPTVIQRPVSPPPSPVAPAPPSGPAPVAPPPAQADLERTLTTAWQTLLGEQAINRHQTFFELGGSSLLLMQLQQRLEQDYQLTVNPLDFFRYPTIATLAAHLAQSVSPPMGGTERGAGNSPASPTQSPTAPDIAIIGMAGQFPGADNLATFWANLAAGVESITPFSDAELLANGVNPAYLNDPNYVKVGGVLSDIAAFDAAFFEYAPTEARLLDPQHRVLLECAWAALEEATYANNTHTARVGVYAGANHSTYWQANLLPRAANRPPAKALQLELGNDKDFLTTRISYKLNLNGPSLNVNTACSTSLVAVHLAIQGLLAGECDIALAGGVTVQVPHRVGYHYQAGMIVSPDGHCRVFDAAAQGTVLGSGVGVVVLKPLALALADGDFIHAIIKGTAINNDGGMKVGFTAPAIAGQAAVIQAAQRTADIDPGDITYLEAHGTATHLGDPIEVAALTEAFQAKTDRTGFCAIGSVKSNIGHLNRAAGMAGLMKTVLALQHRQIPPSLHFQQPNPRLDFENSPFYVNTTLRLWDAPAPRRAGVSSFGFGGTNAHAILEEAPPRQPSDPAAPWSLLCLSAKTEVALQAATANLATHLATQSATQPTLNLGDVAYTLHVGRRAFAVGRTVVCTTLAEAVTALQDPPPAQTRPATPPRLVFTFPGQGAQGVNMGRDLYAHVPIFQQHFNHCAALLRPLLGFDIQAVLYPPTWAEAKAKAQLQQTALTQPMMFAFEYALAQTWLTWGLRPAALLGHSLGECVAACLAGVFSLADGLHLAVERGRLVQTLPPGEMLTVFCDLAHLETMLATDPAWTTLTIAVHNAPEIFVVAGPPEPMAAFKAHLAGEDIPCRPLHTSHAFHSAMLEPILDAFEALVADVPLAAPQIPLISNVTGDWLTAAQATSPRYWRDHLRQTVRFAAGLERLTRDAPACFLEVGPGQTLTTLLGRQAATQTDIRLPSGPPAGVGGETLPVMLESLGQLWLAGFEPNWAALYEGEQRYRLPLPTYPFQRERYWLDAPTVEAGAMATSLPRQGHPLLGARLDLAEAATHRFEQVVDLATFPWLGDHRVNDDLILPGAAFLEMVLAAGMTLTAAGGNLSDLVFEQPLVLRADAPIRLQLTLNPATGELQIFSRGLGQVNDTTSPWRRHISGRLTARGLTISGPTLAAVQAQFEDGLDVADFYRRLVEDGLGYGPAFRGIRRLWRRDEAVLAEVVLPSNLSEASYQIHPALLDAALHALNAALPPDDGPYLPFSVDELYVILPGRPAGRTMWAYIKQDSGFGIQDLGGGKQKAGRGANPLNPEIWLYQSDGELWGVVRGLRLRQLPRQRGTGQNWQDWLYVPRWLPFPWPDRRGLNAEGLMSGHLPQIQKGAKPALTPARLYEQLAPTLALPAPAEARALAALQQVSLAGLVAGLRDLGFPFAVGKIFTAEELGVKMGIVSGYTKLWAHFLTVLTDASIIKAVSGGWQMVGGPDAVGQDAAKRGALAGYEAELMLVQCCTEGLAGVLRGEVGALDLLFGGDGADLARRMYRTSPQFRRVNEVVAAVVQAMVVAWPSDKRLSILEVGGGTGGTTARLLPLLPPSQTDYCFTDVGPHFLREAQAEFAPYPFVRYAPLNIEADPLAQGFRGGEAEVVVAANVLHATRDVRETLAHTGTLLGAGGWLVLVESTQPALWVDLTFGLTDGWWRFTDTDLRPTYPLLTAADWAMVLAEAGFEGVQVCTPVGSPHSVIVAQRGEAGDKALPPVMVAARRRWLLVGEMTLLTALSDVWRRVDDTVQILSPEMALTPAALASWLTQASDWAGVIYAPEFDRAKIDPLAGTEQGLLGLLQALTALPTPPPLWLVTREAVACGGSPLTNPLGGLLWGLAKVIPWEYPALRCVCVDLPATMPPHVAAQWVRGEVTLSPTDPAWAEQVAVRDGVRYVGRLARLAVDAPLNPPNGVTPPVFLPPKVGGTERGAANTHLTIAEVGQLDTLRRTSTTRRLPAADEVEVAVQAAGLNFLDVLNALGVLAIRPPLGGECAGVITAVGSAVTAFRVGQRVVGLHQGSFVDYLTLPAALVAPLGNLTVTEGATIPVAFLTAVYALEHLGGVQAGERVLIHGAAGGVGLAAVQLAQAAGVTVFATASPGKWAVLREWGVQHIYHSRTLDFEGGILRDTAGEGVDLVLNSLTGAGFIGASLRALRPKGRFVELAKRNIWTPAQVAAIQPTVQYHIFDLLARSQTHPAEVGAVLRDLLGRFEDEALKPLPCRTFPLNKAEAAFRWMQGAKHTGKVVLIVSDMATRGERSAIACQPTASYLITGGWGSLGLAVADWLVEQGARHLVLVGRSEPSTAVKTRLDGLADRLESLTLAQVDVSDDAALAGVLGEIDPATPLRGVVHAAGVVADALLRDQTAAHFERVLRPKAAGAWHLHGLTAEMPLDFFVLFSSVAAVLGAPGQGNHAAANGFLDALAHYRRGKGLTGQSINWGAWAEIGYAARQGAGVKLVEQGLAPIPPGAGLAALGYLLGEGEVQAAVLPVAWGRFAGRGTLLADLLQEASPVRAPLKPLSGQPEKLPFVVRLQGLPAQEREGALVTYLRGEVAAVLGLAAGGDVPLDKGFLALGLDSLISIELRNRLQKGLACRLSATLIFDYPTLTDLTAYLLAEVLELPVEGASSAPSPESVVEATEDNLDDLGGDDLAALLAAELGLDDD